MSRHDFVEPIIWFNWYDDLQDANLHLKIKRKDYHHEKNT